MQGSRWSTRRLNDFDPVHLARYTFGADGMGYPHSWCFAVFALSLGVIPERGPPKAPGCLRSMGVL
jgi:hypothetical protein